jgi:hypothetical protein
MADKSLKRYYDDLLHHDWWYEMSDDNSKFERGDKEQRRLDRMKNESPEHRSLYFAMMRYCKHNEGEKPTRPE